MRLELGFENNRLSIIFDHVTGLRLSR